jgi:hypothetical protein
MSRIIILLAAFALILLAATMVVGLSLGDLQTTMRDYRNVSARIADAEQRYTPDTARLPELRAERDRLAAPMDWAEYHRLFGVAAAIGTLLVNCIVVTYFIGTTRWCREVSETYSLGPELSEQSARLKTRTLPWAILSATAVIVTVALGGLADPAATGRLDRETTWPAIHLAAAITTLCITLLAFYQEWLKVAENNSIINRIMAEVHRRQGEPAASAET